MFWKSKTHKRLYLDYAAATPVSKRVLEVMAEVQASVFGNPSAIHREGQRAKEVVEDARLRIARCLQVRPHEVIFTGSGTEANNLAILGYVRALQQENKEVISSTVEHPSVTKVLDTLEAEGVTVHRLAPDEEGFVTAEAVAAALSKNTVLVTFAYANSEVGTVQPVGKIARMVRKYNSAHGTTIKTHLDAAQAPLWLPCQLHTLGVDMLSLDAGKCNGPKGVGMLVKLASVPLTSIFYGGGQEAGLRPATENVAGIAGAAEAIVAAQENREVTVGKAEQLSAALRAALSDIPGIIFNGSAAGATRLPHNVHISLPGFNTEYAVVWLDTHGIAASTKSACSGAAGGRSEVVFAMISDAARANSTIRFTIDPTLSPGDMPRAAEVLQDFMRVQVR